MFWNQKEVYIGSSMQKFNEARQMLADNKINYKYKLVSNDNSTLYGSRRATMGSLGENMAYSNMYYIYVHKNDYKKTGAVLRNLTD